MTPSVPCAVVVDSRNMRGQAGKMFGWPRQVNVAGVKAALKLYGLDVIDVIVGVATRSADSTPSPQLGRSLRENREYRDRLIADGAAVLEGYLVERKTKTSEKQVDVLCAVKVCDLADRIATGLHPARCIVVLSEDMDLMPAYAFARERGVPTYAAAYDTIYQRDDQRDWLLLTEPALASLVSPVGRYIGTKLRSKLAGIATSTDVPKPLTWTVHAPLSNGAYLMRGNLGGPALWNAGRRVETGKKVQLYAAGLKIHPEDGGRFPHLVLQEQLTVTGPMPNVQHATVAYWQTPTSLKVNVGSDRPATVRATPGTLLPGQAVAVLRPERSGPDQATYLIGATGEAGAVAGWSTSASIVMARVRADRPRRPGWLEGEIIDTGDRVLIHRAHLDHAVAGTKLSVFLTGYLESLQVPTVMPLTCCLPELE